MAKIIEPKEIPSLDENDYKEMKTLKDGDMLLLDEGEKDAIQFLREPNRLKKAVRMLPIDVEKIDGEIKAKIFHNSRTIIPTIDLESKKYICTCEDFIYRNNFCKHLMALVIASDETIVHKSLDPVEGDE